jgi:hypothetical protein
MLLHILAIRVEGQGVPDNGVCCRLRRHEKTDCLNCDTRRGYQTEKYRTIDDCYPWGNALIGLALRERWSEIGSRNYCTRRANPQNWSVMPISFLVMPTKHQPCPRKSWTPVENRGIIWKLGGRYGTTCPLAPPACREFPPLRLN